METRKSKMITSLNLVINALKNNTIYYNWTHQESCNCGVVAQALLNVNAPHLKSMWRDAQKIMISLKREDEKSIDPTWQNGVKRLCPITGEPMADVFKRLFDAGLTKEDIVHLEYMDNPAILKRSGIDIKARYFNNESKKVEKQVTTKIPHPFFLFRWFGVTKTKTEVKETFETEKVQVGYYTKQENLILYLQAWVDILNEGVKYKNGQSVEKMSNVDLEKELLNAVAEENYEYATILRNEINLKQK